MVVPYLFIKDNLLSEKSGYGVEDMTFAEEEEVYPAPEVAEPSVTEAKDSPTKNMESKPETKRNLPDKSTEKKVTSNFLLCFICGHDDAKVKIPATVVLRNMFTPAELRQADESLLPELEQDVREECVKLGPIDSVKVCNMVVICHQATMAVNLCMYLTLFLRTLQLSDGGIVLMHFPCMMNLVYRFGGRQIHASEDDGSVNHALIRDIDAEVSRLEQFGAELDAD
ncbi:hypothetical protein BHE74_00010594 [Ensete ventricosum]|nr:hypothetical protein BHE74_00010594 [Ensete ventricosum]